MEFTQDSPRINLFCIKPGVSPEQVKNIVDYLTLVFDGQIFVPNMNQHPSGVISDFSDYLRSRRGIDSDFNAISFDGDIVNYVGEMIGTRLITYPELWDIRVRLLGHDYKHENGALNDSTYRFNLEGVLQDWPYGFFAYETPFEYNLNSKRRYPAND